MWRGPAEGVEPQKTLQRDKKKSGNLGTKPEEGKERRSGGAAPGASVVFETGDRDTKQESESPTSQGVGSE